MFCIEKATSKDIGEVEQLYNAVCRELQKGDNYPGWKEGMYPTRQEAMNGLQEDTLFVYRKEGRVAGTMILNSECEEAYVKGNWSITVEPKDVLVIHTLAIHPDFNHQGIGHQLVEFIKEYGRSIGKKTIRIDVTDGNLPAIHLYQKQGFTPAGAVDLGRADHGLPLFLLYEYIL